MRIALRYLAAGVVVFAVASVLGRSYLLDWLGVGTAAAADFSAGFRESRTTDRVIGKSVDLAIWYPTRTKEAHVAVSMMRLRVAREAAPAGGRFPLVVISHGTAGSQFQHHDTARYLARRGFIVVALSHPEDNHKDDSGLTRWSGWLGRVRQFSLAIDAALGDEGLGRHIDRMRIAAIGYSGGGHTVLAAAGAKARYAALAEHCKRIRVHTRLCGREGPLVENSDKFSLVTERRIRAVVALAPVAAFFGDDAFKDFRARVMIYRAEEDEALPFPHHAARLTKILPKGTRYRIAENAGHEVFEAPEAENGDVEIAGQRKFHRRMNAEIHDFLREALK